MDFSIRLKEEINNLGLPIQTKLGTLGTKEGAVIYAMPGGKVTKIFMDGVKEQQLNFEYAIKSKQQELANNQLWEVSNFIENLDDLESSDESFEFGSIVITSKPASSEADEQGFFYWVVDFTAILTTLKK